MKFDRALWQKYIDYVIIRGTRHGIVDGGVFGAGNNIEIKAHPAMLMKTKKGMYATLEGIRHGIPSVGASVGPNPHVRIAVVTLTRFSVRDEAGALWGGRYLLAPRSGRLRGKGMGSVREGAGALLGSGQRGNLAAGRGGLRQVDTGMKFGRCSGFKRGSGGGGAVFWPQLGRGVGLSKEDRDAGRARESKCGSVGRRRGEGVLLGWREGKPSRTLREDGRRGKGAALFSTPFD